MTRRVPIHQLINGNEREEEPLASSVGSSPSVQQPAPTHANGYAMNGGIHLVHRFVENGREYYAYRNEVTYPFPSDDGELDRLDCLHELIYGIALNKKVISAELESRSPRRRKFLDVGYGTGVWVITVAEEHPDVEVYGIDLIANQPPTDDPSPNVSFRSPVDFAQPNWGFNENFFDLVHMSQLCGSVMDWPQLYRDAARHLRPGTGHLEHIEIDWAPRSSGGTGVPPPLQEWWAQMMHGSQALRRPILYREDTEQMLFSAGFTDIVHKTVRIPIQWGKQDARDARLRQWFIGVMCGESDQPSHARPMFEGLSFSLFCRQLRLPRQYVLDLCEAVRASYFSEQAHFYHNIHLWTARKPTG